MPALSTEESVRLRILNFPLIIGVVYIHAFSISIDYAGERLGVEHVNYLTEFVRLFISQGLARIAVPLFFLMSGYFFFLGFTWSWQGYVQKLTVRIKTLLAPYLFWTSLIFAVSFLGHSSPAVAAYFPEFKQLLDNFSVYVLLNSMFGLTWVPEAYHFWFIRDLIYLMVLSPLIVVVLRYAAWPFFIAIFWLWITANWSIYTPDVVGVLFFSFGGYMGMKRKSLFILDRYGAWFVAAYIIILAVDVIWYTAPFNLCLHRCGIVVGLVATLFITKRILAHKRLTDSLLWLSGSSFFVYAAHEPLLGIIRTIAFQYSPVQLPYTMLLIYLLVPLAVIASLVWLHNVLGACFPNALKVVTGGR
ncbi:MAG: acyltransferase [Desulforhopalus sp.]|nr:acyltransferase [Desulforhopalus sp.]